MSIPVPQPKLNDETTSPTCPQTNLLESELVSIVLSLLSPLVGFQRQKMVTVIDERG